MKQGHSKSRAVSPLRKYVAILQVSDVEGKLHNKPVLQDRDPKAFLALPTRQNEAAYESALSAQKYSQNKHDMTVMYRMLLPISK